MKDLVEDVKEEGKTDSKHMFAAQAHLIMS